MSAETRIIKRNKKWTEIQQFQWGPSPKIGLNVGPKPEEIDIENPGDRDGS